VRRLLAIGLTLAFARGGAAALLADYDPVRHDRFLPSSRVANPGAPLNQYNLTGVGIGSLGGILVSDRHVLAATHFTGGSYTFANELGQDVTINVSGNRALMTRVPDGNGGMTNLPSDLTLVTLSRAVTAADAIKPVPIVDVPLGGLWGSEVWAYDQINRLGRNVLDGGSLLTDDGLVELDPTDRYLHGNQATWAVAFDYDTSTNGGVNGVGGDEVGLVGGDSGHALLADLGQGRFGVIGTHFSVVTGNGKLPPDPGENYMSLSTLAMMYREQIEGHVVTDGGSGLTFATLNVVPEPAAAGAGLVSLAGLLLRRR
jgi:hypothetical protein